MTRYVMTAIVVMGIGNNDDNHVSGIRLNISLNSTNSDVLIKVDRRVTIWLMIRLDLN